MITISGWAGIVCSITVILRSLQAAQTLVNNNKKKNKVSHGKAICLRRWQFDTGMPISLWDRQTYGQTDSSAALRSYHRTGL